MTGTTEKLPSSGHRRLRAAVVFAALFGLLLVAGCGSSSSSSGNEGIDPGNAQDAPDFTKVTKDAPKAIAPLYEQAGQLVDGGEDAFNAQMAELKGYPVVVNKWASWCGPCRTELPHLQQAVATRGDQVAFMGIDASDTEAAAQTFIRDHPVPYLSFSDPDEQLSTSLGAAPGQPITLFYNADGEKTYMHSGPYTSEEALNADIDKYAVNG